MNPEHLNQIHRHLEIYNNVEYPLVCQFNDENVLSPTVHHQLTRELFFAINNPVLRVRNAICPDSDTTLSFSHPPYPNYPCY